MTEFINPVVFIDELPAEPGSIHLRRVEHRRGQWEVRIQARASDGIDLSAGAYQTDGSAGVLITARDPEHLLDLAAGELMAAANSIQLAEARKKDVAG